MRTYLPRRGHDEDHPEAFEAMDFVARLLAPVPDPRRHVVHYYGAYSNLVRGKQRKRAQAETVTLAEPTLAAPSPVPAPSPSPSQAALRHSWARMIRRVYEVDPLLCPSCQGVMRVVAFITEPRVIHTLLEHLARRLNQDRAPPNADAVSPTFP